VKDAFEKLFPKEKVPNVIDKITATTTDGQ